MPLENATSLATLNPEYPLGTDPVASADDHIRLIKSVLKKTFPNVVSPITVSQDDLNNRGVPTGFIGLWSGVAALIPAGWLLCDGQNNTPDLRDRFIVGAGGSYAVGAKGGAINATTTSAGTHTHTTAAGGAHTPTGAVQPHQLTIEELPSHQHDSSWGESGIEAPYGVSGSDKGHVGSADTDNDNYEYRTSLVGGDKAHTHDLKLDPVGTHTHTVDASGDHNHAVDTRSPYYALCYIMKG